MTHLPGLLECAETIRDGERRSLLTRQRLQLVNRCWDLESQFSSWYTEWRSNQTLLWITDCDQPEYANNPFPQSYRFLNLTIAHMHCMYWASMQMIYNMLGLSYEALSGIESSYYSPEHPIALRCTTCYAASWPVSKTGIDRCRCGFISSIGQTYGIHMLRSLREEHDILSFACKISMSMNFCLNEDSRILGPQVTLFPLKMAIHCFTAKLPGTKNHLSWCLAIIDILESKGIRSSRKMLEIYNGLILDGICS